MLNLGFLLDMKGPKPDLNKNLRNVVPIHPTAKGVDFLANASDQPNPAHVKIAKDLRPTFLTADERKFWNATAPGMVQLGRLKPHYVHAYAEYCIVVCRMARTRKFLNENGWTYTTKTRNGLQQKMRPEVGQLNDDWRKWRTLVAMFGLAPAEERGLTSPLQGDMFGDGWDDI